MGMMMAGGETAPGAPSFTTPITVSSSSVTTDLLRGTGGTPASYTVYYRRAGSTGSWTSNGSTTYTGSPQTITISGLTSNYAYEFYATATNGIGTSANSSTMNRTTSGATTSYSVTVALTEPYADPGNLFADYGYDKNSTVDGGNGTAEGSISPTTWATSWTWECILQVGSTTTTVQFRGPTTTQTGLFNRIAVKNGGSNGINTERVLLASEASSFSTGGGSDGSVSTWSWTAEPSVAYLSGWSSADVAVT